MHGVRTEGILTKKNSILLSTHQIPMKTFFQINSVISVLSARSSKQASKTFSHGKSIHDQSKAREHLMLHGITTIR